MDIRSKGEDNYIEGVDEIGIKQQGRQEYVLLHEGHLNL